MYTEKKIFNIADVLQTIHFFYIRLEIFILLRENKFNLFVSTERCVKFGGLEKNVI